LPLKAVPLPQGGEGRKKESRKESRQGIHGRKSELIKQGFKALIDGSVNRRSDGAMEKKERDIPLV
jgi:hypothetical protein